MRVFVLVDLGFGDAGKGLLTDFLVRRRGAPVVVRYNGGAQAGHNVVAPDGRHHTFAQFGSGTLVAGVRTFLSRGMVVHPTGLAVEASRLRSLGVADAWERLQVSEHALIVTPFHQAAGRLRELARGAARHGSCGIGIGEAVAHALADRGGRIVAGDLAEPARLRRKLERVREWQRAEVSRLDPGLASDRRAARETEVLEGRETGERWLAAASRLASRLAGETSWVPAGGASPEVVFEGAHGVLLDEQYGFHPFTTWCRCTAAPAHELVAECAPGAEVHTIGVLRTHAVRHGPGPLPTEAGELAGSVREHNRENDWQGPVRLGWFDAALARYALRAAGGIGSLAVTHLDWLAHRSSWTWGDGYDPQTRLGPPAEPSLERQARLTERLLAARPVLRRCRAEEGTVLERIEDLLGKPVAIGSRGPSAGDVFVRPAKGPAVEPPATAATASGGGPWP